MLPEGARYAVFTHGGAGTSDQPLTQQPVNELSTDISFYPATVTGSVADSSPAGLTVSGAATGIPAGITGAYAAVIEEGDEASLTDPDSEYIAFAFPPFPAVTDGATSFTMTADAAKLDRNKRYEILVWKQHAAATPENIYGRIALDVSEEQWDDVFGMPTTTTVKFSPSTFSYNVKKTATVTVKAERSDEHPTGAVRVKINGKNYDATLANGKAAIQLSTPVNKGTRAVNATFTSDSAEFAGSKGSTTVVVTKATPKVSAKLAKSKVTTKQNGKIKVAVTIPGSLKAKAANFKVKLYDGKKVLRTVTLSKSGTGNVTIPKLKKGTHKIKVTVLSTTNTNSKSSVTRTLKVVS
ncbi:Ig-like domain repeat protein [Leucobacter soli]|uniref:Ig-like domain repeat protein n=1 Tax=Leucobacter soli TaxID=2812850 RepID=UPI0036236B2D